MRRFGGEVQLQRERRCGLKGAVEAAVEAAVKAAVKATLEANAFGDRTAKKAAVETTAKNAGVPPQLVGVEFGYLKNKYRHF